MNYLILDTNVYVNLLFERSRGFKNDTLDKLTDFVRYSEDVSILIPSVVPNELGHSLEATFDDAIDDLESALKSLNKVNLPYSLSYSTMGVKNLDSSKQDIKVLIKIHKDERDSLISQLKTNATNFMTTEYGLDSKSTKLAPIKDKYLLNMLRKSAVSAAPFFNKKNNSQGDALIFETILDIEEIFETRLNRDEDRIFFFTDNFNDFSKSKEEQTELHPRLVEQLKQKQLYSMFYYRRNILETLYNELAGTKKNAESSRDEQEKAFIEASENNWYRNDDN